MLLLELFYIVTWITTISIIWFYTDAVIHYLQLFGIFENIRLKFTLYLKENPNHYFPDFLISQSYYSSNKYKKFLLKLVGCPFCLIVWLSVLFCSFFSSFILIGPVYISSLTLLLGIRRLI